MNVTQTNMYKKHCKFLRDTLPETRAEFMIDAPRELWRDVNGSEISEIAMNCTLREFRVMVENARVAVLISQHGELEVVTRPCGSMASNFMTIKLAKKLPAPVEAPSIATEVES